MLWEGWGASSDSDAEGAASEASDGVPEGEWGSAGWRFFILSLGEFRK